MQTAGFWELVVRVAPPQPSVSLCNSALCGGFLQLPQSQLPLEKFLVVGTELIGRLC